MNYGGKRIVVIPRQAGNDHEFATIPTEKSVLNRPSMNSAISRVSPDILYSIGFDVMAAKR